MSRIKRTLFTCLLIEKGQGGGVGGLNMVKGDKVSKMKRNFIYPSVNKGMG